MTITTLDQTQVRNIVLEAKLTKASRYHIDASSARVLYKKLLDGEYRLDKHAEPFRESLQQALRTRGETRLTMDDEAAVSVRALRGLQQPAVPYHPRATREGYGARVRVWNSVASALVAVAQGGLMPKWTALRSALGVFRGPRGAGQSYYFNRLHGQYRVDYGDEVSAPMCYDVATDYAAIFGGTVIPRYSERARYE